MKSAVFDQPRYVPILLFAGVYLLLLATINNQYYQLMMIMVPIWAVMGISWNIISGYSGLASFGHAAFFGLGAYTVTLLMKFWLVTPWIGIPVATVVGAFAGLLIGWPTFRLRGQYFALAMLAYPLALLNIFEWLGFQEVALPMMRENPVAYMQFSDNRVYGVMALVVMILALVLSFKIERSRFGLSLRAIKQNEIAAEASGIDALRWKLRAIVVSGGLAGGIGGFYAVILLIVTPGSVFGMLTSAQALVVALFGGVGAAWGPVIGASILIPLSETLHAEFGGMLPGIGGVVYGVAIIVVVLVAPEGLYWKFRDLAARRGSPQDPPRLSSTRTISPPLTARKVKRSVGKPLLEVRSLSKSFGGLRAVDDVNFVISEGGIVGIIGPNGAGKTTLFNLLNGIYKPSGGQVLFEGRDIGGQPSNQICRQGVGRTFQVVRAFARLTVLQNVVVGAFVATGDDREAEQLALDALSLVGMTQDADLVASGLTSKQLRLMEIARALAGRPRLLLLDEPLAGLGKEELEELLHVIDGISARGVTVVIIEHTMQAMVRLVDRFIVLDHGAVLAEGEPSTIMKDRSVIEAYLGKKWSAPVA
jgi:ABC-type branched-subunit amino acid transport system ATPase component/ABC-type branched-subunit amino acid transport system permease subunit